MGFVSIVTAGSRSYWNLLASDKTHRCCYARESHKLHQAALLPLSRSTKLFFLPASELRNSSSNCNITQFLINRTYIKIYLSCCKAPQPKPCTNTLLFVKIATPRRRHVTEIKCIPQIRYTHFHKWLPEIKKKQCSPHLHVHTSKVCRQVVSRLFCA